MELLRIVHLRGPNPYFSRPALEVLVNCRGWREERTERLARQLVAHIPFLAGQQHKPSRLAVRGHDPGKLSRELESLLRERTHVACLAEIFEHVARSFHCLSGVVAEKGEVRETDDPDVWIVVVQCEEESLARACLEVAREFCITAVDGTEFPLAEKTKYLVDLADDARLGPSTRAIVDAAAARGIPFRRLNNTSLVQLGEGIRQRRIWTAETDATSAIGESIASDKDLTKRLLAAVGVPVPKGRIVSSPEDAWQAVCEIGIPAVVKPQNANHSRGISLDLTRREQIAGAYDFAERLGDGARVMVEQYAPGQQHRLLVVGDRLVAAACGESEYVTGDGRQTVLQLVEEVNRDPRRGVNYTDLLGVLRVDHSAVNELKKQGLTPESVPEPGRKILIQRIGDLTMDCTQRVHPEVAARAVLAAQTVGLDIAGLDVVADDISRPLEEQRGMILEVNAGPSLSMHIAPLHGEPQPVGDAIVAMLFPKGSESKIPVVAVTGTGARSEIASRIAQLIERSGMKPGLATSVERRFGTHVAEKEPTSDWKNIESLLVHKFVDAAVFESRPDQAAREGIGSSRCDVVVIACEQGRADCRSESDRAGILSAIHALPSTGTLILSADDPDAEQFIARHSGSVAWLPSAIGNVRSMRQADLVVSIRAGSIHGTSPSKSWTVASSGGDLDVICTVPAVVAAIAVGIPAERIKF